MNGQTVKKWAIPSGIALALFLLVAYLKGLFGCVGAKETLGILTDCFTIPGVLLGGVGLLTLIASYGQFDILAFGSRRFFGHFIHALSDDLPSSFYDYKTQKDEKGRTWLKHTAIVGGICMILAGITLIVYSVI